MATIFMPTLFTELTVLLWPARALGTRRQVKANVMAQKIPRYGCFILNWDAGDGLAAVQPIIKPQFLQS
jgi:hypothetical protein